MTTTNFDFALPITLRHEGGISDDPNDHGGLTNMGLVREDFVEYYGHAVTDEEIRACTADLARAIYKRLYWDALGLDLIESQDVALCLFDQGVLQGTGTVTHIAQRCAGCPLIDGVMGPMTRAAVNAQPEKPFVTALLSACHDRFVGIVAKDPSQRRFLAGWLNRLHDLAGICGVAVS
jgi:lysozyme family protein